MPSFAECCVLIPCSTIEDFPSRLDHDAAKSLLGTLTAVWHPQLLALTGKIPAWYRADDVPAAPTPIGGLGSSASPASSAGSSETASEETSPSVEAPSPSLPLRWTLVPEASLAKLPSSLRERLPSAEADQRWASHEEASHQEIFVRSQGRDDALALIDSSLDPTWFANFQPGSLLQDTRLTTSKGREISADDFFALAYTWWQVQVLTRRLRYTSNLDQIYFETRVVDAAIAWCGGDADSAADALHDCFDALAEERDHYFASDPSLVDLTLLTPSTLPKFLADNQDRDPAGSDAEESILATPRNVLVDETLAQSLLGDDAPTREAFQTALAGDDLAWCGGGPEANLCYDELSCDQLEEALRHSIAAAEEATGQPMIVHARLGGSTPGEVVAALACHKHDGQSTSQCRGLIPIDFLNGTGFGDEAKVILGESGHEIEALTAKPIDTTDEASFLTLGTRLGEAIDSGEIATALLVHWPGGRCDSFDDLKRAATWTLALGKFWKIDDYFVDGEHPYHHGSSSVSKPSPTERLRAGAIAMQEATAKLRQSVETQALRDLHGLSLLANPKASSDPSAANFAASLGLADGKPATSPNANSDDATKSQPTEQALIINAHPVASRDSVVVKGKMSSRDKSIFHAQLSKGNTHAIVDVPAWGYRWVSTLAKPNEPSTHSGNNEGDDPRLVRWAKQLGRSMGRGPSPIVDGHRLVNEFMELNLSPDHGGIQGVYSGKVRGNRLSTRVEFSSKKKDHTPLVCKCDSIRTLENGTLRGVIAMRGTVERPDSGQTLAWQSEVELSRGSRLVRYRIRFKMASDDATPSELDWINHPVLKMAFPGTAPVIRTIVREKLHRTSARRFIAPLGFVHEEDDCRTLIATHGNALHRRSEDRFCETLLPLAAASATTEGFTPWYEFSFGFDVPHPIDSAMEAWRETHAMHFSAGQNLRKGVPFGSWLMHSSPSSLRVQVVDTCKLDDGRLAMHLRAIQTTSKSVRGVLRFCQKVALAHPISPLTRPLSQSDSTGTNDDQKPSIQSIDSAAIDGEVKCDDDRIEFGSSGHGVTHLCVVFDNQ
ncbi:hypothetical protein LOC71_01595 [Rhodopirellula sp. JC740]|uniref:Uncharacterized protein n=1 Tax=Rhodopirellula halodulae TaxID=2894198 RepID=A0ABS8NBQ0_9BACT|nr:hypothetical protein [Rhodopirellula sp. JC740]MCC9640949.1 hypothetical protein [Rhodopirellula sp. JC740]